jgi:hypothetical protein
VQRQQANELEAQLALARAERTRHSASELARVHELRQPGVFGEQPPRAEKTPPPARDSRGQRGRKRRPFRRVSPRSPRGSRTTHLCERRIGRGECPPLRLRATASPRGGGRT